jgi:hypothetical protein
MRDGRKGLKQKLVQIESAEKIFIHATSLTRIGSEGFEGTTPCIPPPISWPTAVSSILAQSRDRLLLMMDSDELGFGCSLPPALTSFLKNMLKTELQERNMFYE